MVRHSGPSRFTGFVLAARGMSRPSLWLRRYRLLTVSGVILILVFRSSGLTVEPLGSCCHVDDRGLVLAEAGHLLRQNYLL